MSDEIMNLNDLRNFLATELKRVARGETQASVANASANLAGKILSSVKLELEYSKQVGGTPQIDFIRIKEEDKNNKILEDKTEKQV